MTRRQFALTSAALPLAAQQDDPLVAGIDADVWYYAKNLDTGKVLSRKPEERVRTASTIKLPVMAAVFDLVAKGRVKWDETLVLREEDKVSGSGVLREFSSGIRLPLRDVVHMMIVVSDNTATNMVLERITADAVNEFSDRLGLKQTLSLRKVRGDGNQLKAPTGWSKAGMIEENRRFGLGISTSRDMGVLIEKLVKGEVVSAEASKQMLDILGRQQYKDGIGRRLPEDKYKVHSKSGALDALRSDVGLAVTPGGEKISIAVTVDGMKKVDYSPDNEGLIFIGKLAETLVGRLSRS